MKKNQKIVLIMVVMCAVMVAGIFYWNLQNQKQEAIGSPSDYVVVEQESEQSEQGEGQEKARFVENKKAGLKVRIPDNWTEEKMDIMEGSMVFYSPDAEGRHTGRLRPPLKSGCMIEVAVNYKKTDFDKLEKDIEENQEFLIMQSENKFEMIEINGMSALKNTFDCMDLGHSIEVYTLTENILYGLRISSGPEDIEKCSQEFDEFLKNVVIER